MKKVIVLVYVLGILAIVLGTIAVVEYGANRNLQSDVRRLQGEVDQLNAEIRPLRTSEELMLSLSAQSKEWQSVARPLVEDGCLLFQGPDYCKTGGL
ncbi:MAG: hypothetical protein AAB638_03285, partial [Patescibacteria group bacterium]